MSTTAFRAGLLAMAVRVIAKRIQRVRYNENASLIKLNELT